MIQRIQSVWLLLASILVFLTLKLSFFSGTYMADNQYHQLKGTDTPLIMITTIVLGIITLFTIFLYKKRKVQLRLSILSIVLDLVLVYLYYREVSKFAQGTYSITAAIHLLIILSLIFAVRGINKDDKLIKDSDRLR
ncbi:MAG: DUF4293 domain-containing protein [Ferruginibacter sp.]